MKKLLSVCFSLFFICSSCNNEKEVATNQEKKVVVLDSLSKEKIKLDLFKLSTATKKELEAHDDFNNLEDIIKTLRNSNPYYINKYADSLTILIRTFEENLTTDFDVNTINSRLVVLNTESNLLLELSNKNTTPEKLIKANTQIIKAYNSLIIQLNELSLAIPEDIEKELMHTNDIQKDSIIGIEKKLPIKK